MQVSSISFGKKIPILKAAVTGSGNQKMPVTISEYDCKDFSDVNDVLYIGRDWYYYLNIACDMNDTYEAHKHRNDNPVYHFYVMENAAGKKVALCQTKEYNENIDVQYIETKHDGKQKYCGQTMLAALGKRVLNKNGDTLYITAPLSDVRGFYTIGCGFKQSEKSYLRLEMKTDRIKQFIDEVEKKTNSKMLNINA